MLCICSVKLRTCVVLHASWQLLSLFAQHNLRIGRLKKIYILLNIFNMC